MTVLLAIGATAETKGVVDLGSLDWTLSSANGSIRVPAKVPGQVHLDLWRAGVVEDPYRDLNDFDLRWVALANWTYSTTIPAGKGHESSWLLFNGLDTFADIELCGKWVASTENQFRQYHFDVSRIMSDCTGKLDLKVHFGSAVEISKRIAELPGQETWPEGVEGVFQFRHRQFVRKEQNDFGWDWGPAFVPAGIWQPAFLIQLNRKEVHIRNTLVDIYRQDQLPLLPPDQSQPWVLHTSIDAIGQIPPKSTITYELMDGTTVIQKGSLSNITSNDNAISGKVVVASDKVSQWWPVGLGKQKLYKLKATIVDDSGTSIVSIEKRVGFRTIILNQEPVRSDQLAKGIAPGSNWHFEINGHEFYAKGSNLIPPDAFWTRVTETKVRQLFNSVVAGNQNMLRVWSSGAYLPDFMYDIADELGILLWSEFQFGDAAYPVNPEFLDNVREEAHYQVRRVNHHPSLALWAGGNEMENLVLPTARSGDPERFPQFVTEYEKLFFDVLGVAVFENSKSISYTPSSTSNGWSKLDFSKPQPITQRYWNTTSGEIHGDTDYYNYDYTAAFNFERYPVGRFSNEFGFHSMPSIQSWRQALDTKDLSFESPIVRLRNHHYPAGGLNTSNFDPTDRGMNEMTGAAKLYYPVPNKPDQIANFSSWCHITQVFQADYYGSQIQFYRRGSGLPERQLGSLYWQLEDQWQAPTWAGIEYDGRWKVLHYAAKDKYSNVIISPFFNFGEGLLEIYVTSDLWQTAKGTASFAWYDWSGKKLDLDTPEKVYVSIGPLNSTKILQLDTTRVLVNNDPKTVVLRLDVEVQGYLPNSDKPQNFRHQNWFHPVPLSQAKLVDPGLELSHLPNSNMFRIKATKGVASWIWLDYPAGTLVHFEKNGFWLGAGEEVDVGYTVFEGAESPSDAWIEKVTGESLYDLTVS